MNKVLLLSFTVIVFAMSFMAYFVHAQTYTESQAPKLAFSVISDIHIRSSKMNWGPVYHDALAETKLFHALSDLNAIDCKQNALVINGDLTATGMQRDYTSFRAILQSSPHPLNLLFAIGNHEYYVSYIDSTGRINKKSFPNGATEHQCIQRFLKNTGVPNLYYDRWIQGYHFIMLGSERSAITNRWRGDDAFLSETQLAWLRQKLNEGFPFRPTFVFLHQPIPYTVTGSIKNSVVQADELKNILKEYPQVILFSGHSHWSFKGANRTIYRDGFTMVNDAAVRSCIDTHQTLAEESEGLYVQVYNDKVVIKERDFTHNSWLGQHIVPVPMLLSFPPSTHVFSPPFLNAFITN